jgi:hypothetical protein
VSKLRLAVNIDHVAIFSLSWLAGVRATQLGVGRDSQRMKYCLKGAEFGALSPGWPAFAGHDTLFDVWEARAL